MNARAQRVLVARLDSAGDVLLTGPAIRAVAAHAERVVLVCGRRGVAAARLLPGVDEVIEWTAPWIDPEPEPVARDDIERLVREVESRRIDAALVVTSFHQSPLPLALVLRLAGVARIAAISEDYPGALLDVRHRVPVGVPEAERALSLAAAAGFTLPTGDDGRLRVRPELPDVTAIVGREPYVVVHPGTSVPARAWPASHFADLVAQLAADGVRVAVTGGADEQSLTAYVARPGALDLGSRLDFAELAAVIAAADAIVVANTGPAHLAAAVGTPVVSLFAPTVPAEQWRPYRVPHVLLGDQHAPCNGTRAKICPIEGHPCLSNVGPDDVVQALRALTGRQAVVA